MTEKKQQEKVQKSHNDVQNIVHLMHNVVSSAFCYNPNDESLKEKRNVTRTRPTD